ncbi:hypothetical protein [Lacticaseibacillus absianus]|uniref:hypothetical protein n=1 Tax=Lacticaseibacillus absianus TaxID=2729623 RepID=UPI0015C7C601|nr:hypothetical protein [Lacticaseibacillus absianus]
MKMSGHRFEVALDRRVLALTGPDRDWFNALRLLMWTTGCLRKRAAINAQLVPMLDDLQEAERNGGDAQTFFGQAPQTMAQAILRELPPVTWGQRTRVGGVVAATGVLVALILRAPLGQALALNPWVVLATIGLTGLACWGLLACVRRLPFASHWQTAGWCAAMLGVYGAWLVGLWGLSAWDQTTWHWALGLNWRGAMLVFVGVALLVAAAWYWLAYHSGVTSLRWVANVLGVAGCGAATWYRTSLAYGSDAVMQLTVYGLYAGALLLYLVIGTMTIVVDRHL